MTPQQHGCPLKIQTMTSPINILAWTEEGNHGVAAPKNSRQPILLREKNRALAGMSALTFYPGQMVSPQITYT